MRLIDADSLKKDIVAYKTMPEIRKAICDVIDNAPTVEKVINIYPNGEVIVQEKRPKAKWIWRETGTSICRYGYFTCSNCSFVSKAKQNFCAECGSDMRKGGAE